MATGASEGLLRCIYEACLSMQDMEIERRPYHRNCSCELHKSKNGFTTTACSHHKKISYPKRQSWRQGCLSSTATQFSTSSPSSGNALLVIEKSEFGLGGLEESDS